MDTIRNVLRVWQTRYVEDVESWPPAAARCPLAGPGHRHPSPGLRRSRCSRQSLTSHGDGPLMAEVRGKADQLDCENARGCGQWDGIDVERDARAIIYRVYVKGDIGA